MEGTVGNHCVKCTAVNQCWFKNEKGKKPEPFEITKINLIDDIINGLTPGFYHYLCHCREYTIFRTTSQLIELIVPDGKAWWTLSDKKDWINSMGYDANSSFINILEKHIKIAYSNGNYEIRTVDKYGVRITLNVKIPGGSEKKDKIYQIKSGMSIFPNGKLKCNTYIGGK